MNPLKKPTKKLTEAQRRQRAEYSAQMTCPPSSAPRPLGTRAGEAFALHAATGLRTTR